MAQAMLQCKAKVNHVNTWWWATLIPILIGGSTAQFAR
jgi:hypothetical protein